jgi:hypothetical protein
MISTTKSGADQFHGVLSDYYNNQSMFAKTVFMGPNDDYNPFHTNNFSAAVGGPIMPRKQLFFFFAVEPLRSSASTGNQTIFFPDQEFARWAQQNYPNTFGTKILNTYVPSGASISGVSRRASDIFPSTCGSAATNNLPCSTAMVDSGIFNSSTFRDGDQYFFRADKQFAKDRLYGSFFRTTLNYGGPSVIPQFSTTNHNTQYAIQVNYTHVFSPNTLNEVIFASNRIEGFIGETGDFTIPNITVTGQSVGYGVGFAQGNFIQHNYQWRDVLTHVRGAHVLKFGYEGWFGDDVEPFQGPWSHPIFVRQFAEARAGCAAHARRRDVRPGHRATEAVGMERRVENVGRVRAGHLESATQSDGDARLPLRRSGESVVAQRYDGVRQFLSGSGQHDPGARREWRRAAIGQGVDAIAQGVQPAGRRRLGRDG